jgi:hypothetical protein
MAIIKETKYLTFDSEKAFGKKTNIIYVCSKFSGLELATIQWYGRRRQYCFFPSLEVDTVWNNACLQDVIDVISQLMNERRIQQIKKLTGA